MVSTTDGRWGYRSKEMTDGLTGLSSAAFWTGCLTCRSPSYEEDGRWVRHTGIVEE